MLQPTFLRSLLSWVLLIASSGTICAQQITTGGQPAQLDIRKAGANSIRITLKPLSFKEDFPSTPALAERKYAAAAISLRELNSTVKKKVGNLQVEVRLSPLTVIVTNAKGQVIQQLTFGDISMLYYYPREVINRYDTTVEEWKLY